MNRILNMKLMSILDNETVIHFHTVYNLLVTIYIHNKMIFIILKLSLCNC